MARYYFLAAFVLCHVNPEATAVSAVAARFHARNLHLLPADKRALIIAYNTNTKGAGVKCEILQQFAALQHTMLPCLMQPLNREWQSNRVALQTFFSL